jgi:hypothetical protein
VSQQSSGTQSLWTDFTDSGSFNSDPRTGQMVDDLGALAKLNHIAVELT